MFSPPKVLATDLDGTLIPLDGSSQNGRDLRLLEEELHRSGVRLAFATGRHFASVQQAIAQFQLPTPDWIICDVGTSIYQRIESGKFEASANFARHLREIVGDCSVDMLAEHLSCVPRLRLQEAEKQSSFKLSYYAEAHELHACVEAIEAILREQQLPYSVIASVDPFNHDGLIDLLPRNSSKAYALQWWARDSHFALQDIVYAGDSGNDSAALGAGYRAIVVGNAAPAVLVAAEQAHAAGGWSGRIYAASDSATSGVLEGLRHFLSSNSSPRADRTTT